MKPFDIEHFPAHIIEWAKRREMERTERDENARRLPLYVPMYNETEDESNDH